ncbi:unnamed protein product [Oppiella nova]|uniref:peptide-methionine (S)-S-oxide reductase n=1 Tax=Oppiella nova TaxID=334625 RepID=A0A7R9QDH3_9ACAR|nr:unnamed protein product [Oppiella nova]CAG2163124.1 unnamed protein product [Oppiella nova]
MSAKSEAIFGLQCFWGSEVKFGILEGVISTSVGYTGGSTPHPTYKNLSDHTEVVKVVFDSNIITYSQLLETLWSSHDPVATYKTQYKSAIFCTTDPQKQLAEESLQAKQTQLSQPIVTEILALNVYYLAEHYHQKYFLRKHPTLLSELALTDSQLVDSPVATRLNSYCAGFGSVQQLDNDLKSHGLRLSPHNEALVKELIRGGPNLGEC